MTNEPWPMTRLKHVSTVQTGVTLSGEGDQGDPEWPYLRVANVQVGYVDLREIKTVRVPPDKVATSMLQPGDVLMTEGGDIDKLGRGALWRGEMPDMLHQNHIFAVRPDKTLDSKFLVYWLDGPVARTYFRTTAKQTTNLAGTNKWTLGNLPLPAPSLDEQRRLVKTLDDQTAKIDTLIEEQQHLIEILRERRAAVLSATFNTGSSAETSKVGRLLAVRPSYGVLVPKYVDEAEGVPFVRVGDLLNLAPERPMLAIAPEQSDEYSRTKIVGGEVLLGVVGKMGQAALAPQWLAGANVARAVAVLRCKDPAIASLLCAWLGSTSFLRQAELATSGDSIQPTLGMKDLARFDINLPINPNAATNLADRLAKIDTLIAETERFIELARERRAALIAVVVTGQVDVREMV